MKKISTLIVFIALFAAGYLMWPNLKALFVTEAPAPAPAGKLMAIEDYVRQNISALSPEKEVLGGTYYVTEISASDGVGVVSYEDGHNAYTADFTYVSDDRTGHTITSFKIR
jgi:hypothetical protein